MSKSGRVINPSVLLNVFTQRLQSITTTETPSVCLFIDTELNHSMATTLPFFSFYDQQVYADHEVRCVTLQQWRLKVTVYISHLPSLSVMCEEGRRLLQS